MADPTAKKVRFTDMTLLKNDVLRPWTIDLNLDRKLQQEAVALDKVLAFTTPQKFAGTLASSVLDSKLNEYAEFTTTLDQRIKTGIITSTGIIPRPETANFDSNIASNSTRMSSNRSDSYKGGSSTQSRNMTPAVDEDECFTAADLAYIDRMKRSSLYKKSMRASSGRPHTSYAQSLQGIRYSEQPFGPVSPSKMIPQSVLLSSMENKASAPQRRVMATSAEKVYDLNYYLKGALAGGICCAVTHGALCPVDVVKTRIQLDPVTFNRGLIGGFKQIIEAEGPKGLLTGLGPTVVGYFIQGWFKFGGVEFFKVQFAKNLGDEKAWNNKTAIYLASSAMAEFIADIFLCPLEATRIRLVSQPTFADGLISGAGKLFAQEGLIKGFYSGFGPILMKQIPYTMAKFAVQGEAADRIAATMGKTQADLTGGVKLGTSLLSGVIAGVCAAVISHPADTLLSKVNKAGAGGEGSIATRLGRIASEIGFVKLCTVGLGARCVMIGTLTAGQFLLFDIVMDITGAEKFHFHPPAGTAAH